eukprot:9807236-Alexandrium_andersonii.AAC.1
MLRTGARSPARPYVQEPRGELSCGLHAWAPEEGADLFFLAESDFVVRLLDRLQSCALSRGSLGAIVPAMCVSKPCFTD